MARALGVTEGRQSRWMIIAAILFAAIAAVLVFAALRGSSGDDGRTVFSTQEIVVARQSISANDPITADMIEIRTIPDGQVLSGAYTDTADVEGLVARYPVQPGEQVTTAKLGATEIEEEKDLALVVPIGKRGAAIEVTEMSSVGGLLLAGNRVDLIAVIGGVGPAGLRSVIVAQNLEVLSVAQEAQEPVPAPATEDDAAAPDQAPSEGGLSGQRPDEVERQPSARTVTLAVSPRQALILAALQAENALDNEITLYAVLRAAGDDQTTPDQALDVSPFIFPQPPESAP